MKKIFIACYLLLAVQCYASFKVYGLGNIGVMPHWGTQKFTKLEKYGGGLGLEYSIFSLFSLGVEINYLRGSTTDPIPDQFKKEGHKKNYPLSSKHGVDFINVHYFEFWLRPKLMIPIPLIQPYIAIPLSPLSFGGLQGNSNFGLGFGAVGGIQLSFASVYLFTESGFIVRRQKVVKDIMAGQSRTMLDFSIPINLGVGYSF